MTLSGPARPSSTSSFVSARRRDDYGHRRSADRGRLDDVAPGGLERRHHRRAAHLPQLRQPGPPDSSGRLQRHATSAAALQGVGGSVTVHGSREQDQRVTLNGINIDDAAGRRQHRRPDSRRRFGDGNDGRPHGRVGRAADRRRAHQLHPARRRQPVRASRRSSPSRTAAWQADNFTDELKAAGLTTPNEMKKNWDLNPSFGGTDQARQGLVLVLVAVHRRRKLGAGVREQERIQARRSACMPDPATARVLGGALRQQQPADDVAGDAEQQDRRHLQA